MGKRKSIADIITQEHDLTCSKCLKKQDSLKSLVVFWIPALWSKVDISDPAYKYKKTTAYNMADVKNRRYYICDSCYKKAFWKSMLLVLIGIIIAAATPILYVIENNTGYKDIAGFTPDMESISGGLLVGLLVIIFTVPTRRKILDNLSRFQLKTDLINGKFGPRIPPAGADAAQIWTELHPINNPNRKK